MASDLFLLDPLPPAPDGPLTISIRCSTVRPNGPGTRHDITINPDWSITTPHDLELERIASAMGGYLSCLDFADHTLPALNELVQLNARRVLPQMTRDSTGRWRLPCTCYPNDHANAVFAADHARDLNHVCNMHDVPRAALGRLFETVAAQWGSELSRAPHGNKALVREFDGIERLWEAGVHPEIVRRLYDRLWPNGPAMPLRFYLGAIVRRPDLDWVGNTLDHIPDEDVAVWLCWTETELDRQHPDARIAWLQAGVPRQAIVGLLAGDYLPEDVARLVARSNRTVARAASTFAAWAHAGCHPNVVDILMLDELDVDPFFAPSPAALDWLYERAPGDVTRTQAGLVLAVCGNRRSALHMFDCGVRDPRAAAALLSASTTTQVIAQ